MAAIAVLLRNGTSANATIRYALKCSDVAVQITKTPIQIPIPQQAPQLIDIGVFRPSITVTGVVDGPALTNITTSTYEGMQSVSHTPAHDNATPSPSSQLYYIPYKNKLEDVVYAWIADENTDLEIELGNATFPLYTTHTHGGSHSHQATNGGIYKVAIQQARFQLNAAKEDRWDFTMQFVCESRNGVAFPQAQE